MSSPDPQKTYAVVVGIEKYNKGESWNLSGATLNALNFTKWLLDRKVPSGNIQLYISELHEPNTLGDNQLLQNIWNKKQEATRDNIYNEMNRIIDGQYQGDLLYIHWSGHGTICHNSYHQERRLFYQDGEQNLNVQSLLNSLKNPLSSNTRFKQQILIFDTCANKYKGKNNLSNETFKYDERNFQKEREQVVLLATKAGFTAKYDNIGLFSRELLKELEKKQNLLVPEEMLEVQRNVVNIFEQEHSNEQKPISLYLIDKDGNERGLNQYAIYNILIQKNWETLKQILSKIDGCTLYLACWLLLSELTKDKDIDGNYPKINTLKSQYSKLEEIPDILWEILFIDTNQNEEGQAIFILLKFVLYLIQITETESDDLKEWNQNFINQLQRQNINLEPVREQISVHLKNLKEQYKTCQPYLMINYEPNQSQRNKVNLSAELIFQENNNKPSLIIPIAEKIECLEGLENIKEQIDHFIRFTIKTIRLYGFTNHNEQLIIEMFLPDNQLIKPAEQSYEKILIKIDTSDNRKWISGHYKFTLRSWSRLENIKAGYINLDSITKKWNQLNNNPQFEWVDYLNITPNINNSDSNIVGIGLLSTATIFQQKNSINQVLQTQVINQGLPLFVWMICDEPEELKQQVTQNVLTENNLTNLDGLLAIIKDQRSHSYKNHQTQRCWGYYLSFLCDNPYRLPSKYSTIGSDILIFGF
jgi:hypothetical protein